MQRRAWKFLLAGALLTVAAVAFGVASFTRQGASLDHYTPDQLVRTSPGELGRRGIQVDGFVAEGSEKFNPNIPELRFQVRDLNKTVAVDVVYRAGLKPDSFQEGQGVVVEGKYDPQTRTIEASKLMTKCPSKYEADPQATAANTAAQPSTGETP